jgi:hypothetical protein
METWREEILEGKKIEEEEEEEEEEEMFISVRLFQE